MVDGGYSRETNALKFVLHKRVSFFRIKLGRGISPYVMFWNTILDSSEGRRRENVPSAFLSKG